MSNPDLDTRHRPPGIPSPEERHPAGIPERAGAGPPGPALAAGRVCRPVKMNIPAFVLATLYHATALRHPGGSQAEPVQPAGQRYSGPGPCSQDERGLAVDPRPAQSPAVSTATGPDPRSQTFTSDAVPSCRDASPAQALAHEPLPTGRGAHA